MNALELAIVAWLDAKGNRSKSIKTWTAYRDNLSSFRAALQSHGLDLDGDPRAVALAAQGWAGQSVKDRDVSPATYNQRLACVSSFYTYARKQGLFEHENPIGRVERRRVQSYAHASAIDVTELKDRLKAIPRESVEGKRDYALLNVALNTGRRLSELAGLRWRDVRITGDRALVTWQRAKGGKVMSDKLPAPVTRALLEYLHAVYDQQLGSLDADAPVWVSLSPHNRGQALGTQSIADICKKRLNTSKVHSLRHTFARMMEDDGAKVSDIQARLGHESLATTGRYLAALRRAENEHADSLAAKLGLE
jgi:site-specific recombinase XerD